MQRCDHVWVCLCIDLIVSVRSDCWLLLMLFDVSDDVLLVLFEFHSKKFHGPLETLNRENRYGN